MQEYERKRISIIKGNHKYIFLYNEGGEIDLLNEFVRLASDSKSGFNWFDAAVLTYQINKGLEKKIN